MAIPSSAERLFADVRGQSELIGMVLVFGLVITGAVMVVVIGASAIDTSSSSLENDRAEKSMTQFASKAALVSLGDSDTQQINLPSDMDQMRVNESAGWMRVNITDLDDGTTETLVETDIGALEYENGETTLAYQGGGVWSARGNGSTMISPPEFHYRSGTLTLPIISVTGDDTVSNSLRVSSQDIESEFPNANRANPLEHHEVELTIQSEYYQAWGTFMETRTDGGVTYYHDEKKVVMRLETPPEERVVESAIGATSAAGDITIRGASETVDSYNSSEPGFAGYDPAAANDDGDVTVSGNVSFSGNSEVEGSVTAGGYIEMGGAQSDISGWANYTDGENSDVGHGSANWNQIDGVDAASPIDFSTVYEDVEDENDNDDTNVISGNEIVDPSAGPLPSGDYYLDQFELSGGETLELDTSGEGDVRIVVRDYADWNNADVQVTGDGTVRLYIDGQSTVAGEHFLFENSNVETNNPQHNSTQMWVYGDGAMQAKLDDGDFTGVIYAPAGSGGDSHIVIDGDVAIFGGLVAGHVEIPNSANHVAIHYDESLDGVQAIEEDTSYIATLTYLHITSTHVSVSS